MHRLVAAYLLFVTLKYYDNDLLTSIQGILNGSSNFILSRIFNHGESYNIALKKRRTWSFADNPAFDVMGFDTLYKLIILTVHGFRNVHSS